MGLAASALEGLGSGRSPGLIETITSRASAITKEEPDRYEWKRLDSGNNKEAFTVSSAIQQMIEAILMLTDIFIPLRPGAVCTRSEKGRYTDWRFGWIECLRVARPGKIVVFRAITG